MRLIACRKLMREKLLLFSKATLRVKLLLFMAAPVGLPAHATGVDQEVSLHVSNMPMKEVFKEITRQTGYTFVYTESQLQKSKPVSVEVHNATLEGTLSICFQDQPLNFTIVNRMVVVQEKLSKPEPGAVEPPLVVSGTITGQNGEPLAGASVSEKGSGSSILTKEDGSFSITLTKPNAILVVSYVGYATREIAVNRSTSLNIEMLPTNARMNDVVVIGYGTAKRKDLTGAVASVNNSQIRDLGVTRVDQALLGKVAGVQVKPATGEPGASPQIRVRGIGSISASATPLYVVDGFPTSSIETLNPNDIESLDILKDASATAIYGSRGSNGVIIINTRRGKAGKTQITFDPYYGWQKVIHEPKMMDAKQQAQYFFDGVRNRNLDAGNNVTGDPATWINPVPTIITDVISGKNTYNRNALDQVLVTAPQQHYQVTASGGSDNFRFAVSGEYFNQQGIVLNSHFTRYSVRANMDAKLSKRLTIRVNLNPSFTDKAALPETGNQGENTLGSAISVSNFYPLLNPDGSYFVFSGLAAQADFSNPLAVAREYKTDQKGMRLLGNVEAEYKILDELTFRVLAGASLTSTKGMLFKPSLPVFLNVPATGTDNASQVTNWLTEYTLNYNKSFGDHHFSALAGFTAQEERADSNYVTSNRFPNNLVNTLSAVSGIITDGSSMASQWSLISYLARANYNYNSKYYATASIRTDGSSRFGSNNKYGLFPSAALAWRVSKENFFQEVHFMNELKIRASYGQTGNNNIGNYQQYATINYIKYPLAGVAVGGNVPAALPNPNLTWEKQASLNLGIDASVLNSRINFSIDHFQSTNNDLLLNVNVPSITGFNNSLQNIGEVKNTGWELVVNTVNVKGRFEWTTDFNISTFKNKVVRLGPQGDPIYSGINKTMVGQPIGMFYGYLTDGIFTTAADLAKGPIYNPGATDHSRVGDIRFKDISGPNGKPDGVINSYDLTLMGSPYPDFYYGMTNRFAYQDFSLSISLQGTHGNKVYDNSRGAGNSTRARVRVYAFDNNYWKSEQNPGDGHTPRPNDAPTGGVRLASQAFLDNGTYLRVNNITLAYNMPVKMAQKLSFQGLRIYVSTTNPFLITKFTTYNPDASTSDNPLQPGNESNDYPLAKSLIIGLNVTF